MTELRGDQLSIQDIVNDPLMGSNFASAAQGALADTALQNINSEVIANLSDVVITTPAATEVLTFDGTNWINQAAGGGAVNNWLIANNGTDFSPAPIATGTRSIAIGSGGSTNTTDAIAIGTNATITAYATYNSIAIGTYATIGGYGTDGIAIGSGANILDAGTIAIGKNASSTNSGVSLGDTATGVGAAIAIGVNAAASSSSSISIGATATINSSAVSSIAIGYLASSSYRDQVLVGSNLSITTTTIDVPYSVKLGYGGSTTAEKNVLHLFSRGKLELYGTEAQFIIPNYTTATIPPTTDLGGLIYDIDTNELKIYDAGWNAIGGSNNWLTANNGADFTVAPSATGTESIALGTGVVTSLAGQVAIGANLDSTDVTTDVADSVKVGTGGATKNILHLFSNGKLELYGTEAQFVLPNYITASLPGTTIEGGAVWDSTTKNLRIFDGTAWNVVGANNWVFANGGADFGTAPSGNGIAIGNAATANGIAIGNTASANSTSSIVIGSGSSSPSNKDTIVGNSCTAVSSSGYTTLLGVGNQTTGSATTAVVIGAYNTAAQNRQVVIGSNINSGSTISDLQSDIKIGTPSTNLLYMTTGQLKLYGSTAQFLLPNYTTVTLPATTIAGGIAYDTDIGELTINDGVSWNAVNRLGVNNQTGTTYTLVVADKGGLVNMNNAAANTVTVPPNSTASFAIGTQILVSQEGAGQTAIAAGTGVTLNSPGGFLLLSSQYTTISLIKKATDTWLLVGDLV